MSSPTVRVRPATVDDVSAIADLEAGAFASDAWPEGYLREGVEGLLHGTVLHVALDVDPYGLDDPGGLGDPDDLGDPGDPGGEVIGYAITSIVFEVAELQRIAVQPAQRRRGVAGALLVAVRDEATRREAERLLLEVRETNAGALAFYERAGFVEIDRRSRYYRDGTTAIILQLALTD